MQIYDGPSFLWERPMTIGLLVLAVLLIFLPSYRQWRAGAKIKKARERYDQ
jgi:putative tricarboxylic transport membrane protein